jgi:hypothetical protein
MRDLACVVHVHSTYSDGTATVPEILSAARAAGADAVLLTDHDSLGARRDGWEGRHDGVLLGVGMEVSPKGGHLLAFGVDDEIGHEGRTAQEICAAVSDAGGLAFPAHPFSTGSAISKTIGRPHPWPALDDCDITGLEVWSLMTEAAERCSSLRELARFVRDPESALGDLPHDNLARWDELCRTRRVVGIGGLDAHQSGLRIRDRPLSPHPNERIFRTLRTHVLTPDDPEPRDLYDALAAGRCYLAMDALAPATGFEFAADGPGGRAEMGSEVAAGEWKLRARLPRTAELEFVRDGEVIDRTYSDRAELAVAGDGVFRVQAALGGRTWIVSNPIYIR